MFKVYHFKKLTSTNDRAKDFTENSVSIADEQTKGKGRFKRGWSSAKGGIYLSIVSKIKDKPSYLTLIAAISTQKAIEDIYGIKTIIKWPNDLIYNGKKVCGILTTINKQKAIIGIGMNTNNKIPFSLRNKATSLNKILKKKVNNKKIIKRLLNHFGNYLKLLKNRKYSKIIKDWKKNSFLGFNIEVKTGNKKYIGIACNIDKNLFLILKDKEGRKIKIIEGDIIIK